MLSLLGLEWHNIPNYFKYITVVKSIVLTLHRYISQPDKFSCP